MSTLSSDTHPKIEALQIQLWRQASPTRKMQMVAQLNASARLLALTGLRHNSPTPARLNYTSNWRFCSWETTWHTKSTEKPVMQNEPIEVTVKVINVFEKLGLAYLIGGSLAVRCTAWYAPLRIRTSWPKCASNIFRRLSRHCRVNFT